MSETVKTVLIDGGFPVALGDEDARFIYNLLPVGEFYDKRYGLVSITPAKVQQMQGEIAGQSDSGYSKARRSGSYVTS